MSKWIDGPSEMDLKRPIYQQLNQQPASVAKLFVTFCFHHSLGWATCGSEFVP
jgi:hypothetical protein